MKLAGQRIALFEARLEGELAALVRRSGGEPVCFPAVRERRQDAREEVARLLDEARGETAPVFVFSTGVGATAFFDQARALGRGIELRDAITRGVAVCRGPKPVAALHREGVAAAVKAESPFTTAELLAALAPVEVEDRLVVLVHYGERNDVLADALSGRGARLRELTLYRWELPEDTAPLSRAVDGLVRGDFAAAAFTSQIQVRHLVAVADAEGRREELVAALASRVVVVAVGPTCARALSDLGVSALVPQSPKMGPMLSVLVARLAGGARA